MKPKILAIIFLTTSGSYAYGQNLPTAVTTPLAANSIVTHPGNYPTGTKVNYVRVHQINKPIQDASQIAGLAINNDNVATKYTDGLGRTVQTVQRRAQLGFRDIVHPVYYDKYGRQNVQLLPYAEDVAGNNTGSFKKNAFTDQIAFNTAAYPGEMAYYGKVEIDDNTLYRSIEKMKPGASNAGRNVGVTEKVELNIGAEDVKMWTLSSPYAIPTFTASWPANRLYVHETLKEDGNRIRIYKDKHGKTILSKVEVSSAAAGSGHQGWLCTYYVYDEYGKLRIVLPPKVIDSVVAYATNGLTQSIMDNLCYRYDYDKKSRLIVKKLPGQGYTHIIYDKADRPVLVQTPNLTGSNQWLFTKYDGLGRPFLTGKFLNTSNLLKDNIAADLDDAGTSSNAFIAFLESNVNSNDYTPSSIIAEANIYAITYYDTYQGMSGSYSYHDGSVQDVIVGTNGIPAGKSIEVMGRITGGYCRVMDGNDVTSQWLGSAMFYDTVGRVIQVQSSNFKGGIDTVSMRYDFQGKLLGSLSGQRNPLSSSSLHVPYVSIRKSYIYDGYGRLTDLKQKIHSEPYWRTIMRLTYDQLGRVKQKVLGSNAETQNYTFRVWGAVEAINKDYCLTGTGNHFFGELLRYDYGYNYVSKIPEQPSGMRWRLKGSSSIQRSYGYRYDAAARLKIADYAQSTDGVSWSNTMEDYTAMGITYDGNGNLTAMRQWGTAIGYSAPFLMDQMVYRYKYSGMSNQLDKVNDAVSSYFGLNEFRELGGANTVDYSYDNNGNATKDVNKNITAITYNHLSKPVLITFTNNRSIKFAYAADGTLLKKEITEQGQPSKEISYLGHLEYTNDILSSVEHEEGRVRPVTITNVNNTQEPFFEYDFFVKDHQGNVRSTITEEPNKNWFVPAEATLDGLNFAEVNHDPIGSGQKGFTVGARHYQVTSEFGKAAIEEMTFDNVAETRDAKPGSIDTTDQQATRLNAGEGSIIGPSVMLRVMAGDKLTMHTSAYYTQEGEDHTSSATLQEITTALVSALSGGGAYQTINESGINPAFTYNSITSSRFVTAMQELKNQNTSNGQRPQAFLNYLMLDEKLNVVGDNSGFIQTTIPDEWNELGVEEFEFTHSGYVIVFLSNESAMNVMFDNLDITHWKGKLLEESHYYPYGLTVVSKAYTQSPSNNALFNTKQLGRGEFSDGTGLEWYNFDARQYDPQIGRWHASDPLGEQAYGWTPYRYAYDNPVVFTDPNGMKELPAKRNIEKSTESGGVPGYFGFGGPTHSFTSMGITGLFGMGGYNPLTGPPVFGPGISTGPGSGGSGSAGGGGAPAPSDPMGINSMLWLAYQNEGTSVHFQNGSLVGVGHMLPELQVINHVPQYYTWGRAVDAMFGGSGSSPLADGFSEWAGLMQNASSKDYQNWLSNTGTALRMTAMWATGYRPFGLGGYYNSDNVSNAMRNAWKVNNARNYFYSKYKGSSSVANGSVTNYAAGFGLIGLFRAGIDPVEQFIGSYDINISVINGNILQFNLTNMTSFKSFLYGIGPAWGNGPMGNFGQTYIFKEAIDYSRLK